MTKWQIMKMGTISILDNMRSINSLYLQGDESTAWHSLQTLSYKIDHLWEYDICSLDQMREIKHVVKIWAEKKFSKGYLV